MEKKRKTYIGRVLSHKMDKTATVIVETRQPHPRYRRVVTYRKQFKVHDEDNSCKIGDLVRFIGTRPLSKEKRWRVVEILAKGRVAEVKPSELDIELQPSEMFDRSANKAENSDPNLH